MPKFIALFIGGNDADKKPEVSQADQQAFMTAWGEWAQAHQATILDGGMPLGATLRVDADGSKPGSNSIVAYAIVEAKDHKAAAALFETHPHVKLLPGNSIEVLEGLAIPR